MKAKEEAKAAKAAKGAARGPRKAMSELSRSQRFVRLKQLAEAAEAAMEDVKIKLKVGGKGTSQFKVEYKTDSDGDYVGVGVRPAMSAEESADLTNKVQQMFETNKASMNFYKEISRILPEAPRVGAVKARRTCLTDKLGGLVKIVDSGRDGVYASPKSMVDFLLSCLNVAQQFMCRRALFLTVLHEFWELGGCTPPIHRPNAPPRRGERGISAASGQHAARRGQSRKKSQHVGFGNDHLGMCRQHARGAATP